MNRKLLPQHILLLVGLVIIGGIILTVPFSLPGNIGALDFRPYWSASYLLAHGQDFSDPAKLDSIQRTLTGWRESYTMQAWFAPTGNVILLPYTVLPFPRAVQYWLLTNIAVVFGSVLLIWRQTRVRTWIPLVAAFSFSMTLLSLIAGQVNTLEVLGLALFLAFSRLGYDYRAGVCLALTTIKPHLVILTLPIVLLHLVWRAQWRVLIGFIAALIVCTLILFAFYPQWPDSFMQLVTSGMNTLRETPTLTGLLVVAGEYTVGKWIWVVALVLSAVFWWKYKEGWDQQTWIDISVIAGLLVSPIGWSYDQIMLLFPILRVLAWTANGALPGKDVAVIVLVLVIANAITFYERILSPSEVWFFWVPLLVALVYGFAWQRRRVPVAVPSLQHERRDRPR